MKSSEKRIPDFLESQSLAEEFEEAWATMMGESLDKTLKSSEIANQGIEGLEKLVKDKLSGNKEKDRLLKFLGFLKKNKENFLKILEPEKKPPIKFVIQGISMNILKKNN